MRFRYLHHNSAVLSIHSAFDSFYSGHISASRKKTAFSVTTDPSGVMKKNPLQSCEAETCTTDAGNIVVTPETPLHMEQSTEPVCEESVDEPSASAGAGPAAASDVEDLNESVGPRAGGTTEEMMDSPFTAGVDGNERDANDQTDPVPVDPMEDSITLMKNSILEHISRNTEAYFKSQQKDEPDLTTADKWKIAENLLNKSLPTFLSRYAKYLHVEHLEYFADSDDSLVQYYVEQRNNELKKSSSYSKATVRNRRLEALKRLSEKGEYFSDKEMKRRNPLLFEELVGQFLTNDQKFEFETTGDAQPTSFAAFFMDIVEKGYADSKMMKEVESDVSLMKSGEPSQSSSHVVLWGEMAADSRSKQRVLNNSRLEEVSEGEKHNLLNEFRSKVFTDFLGGRDDEFDYSEVDGNADYDDLNAMEQDQQEGYFDSESPQTVMDEDEDSDSGCLIGLDCEFESRSQSPKEMKAEPT